MNRKGFTLIEVLVVIIILAIVLVIGSPYIITAYQNSKLKSEEIFVNRLSDVIDSYVKLNTDRIAFNAKGTAIKQGQAGTVTIYHGTINDRLVTINDIIVDNLISSKDYINAGNKDAQCNINAQIEVYKDSDFVYCHKVEASSLNCLTDNYIKSICPKDDETCYVIDTCIWSR